MTARTLIGWISWVIAVQVAVGIGLAAWRQRGHARRTTSPAAKATPTGSAGLVSHEVLPFAFALLALIGAAIAIDALLHHAGLAWIGRYLGIPGTVLILGSFGYSLRKHRLMRRGHPLVLLRLHEALAWSGALLVLVHAGIHFNAILAWLAVGAMLINVVSGLTGKFLLTRARRRLESTRERFRREGLTENEIAQNLHWDSLTVDIVRRWRAVHFPIALAFAVLALAHVIATLVFWNWR